MPMSTSKNSFTPAALAFVIALAFFATAAHADTLVLGNDPSQVYNGINVGPYPVTLDSVPGLAFCITETLTATWGTSYSGNLISPTTQAQEEAAFLASYALDKGLPGSNSSLAGPVSYAIWETMTPDLVPGLPAWVVSAAQPFISMANYAYGAGLITPAFLSTVKIFVPDDPAIQSFVMAVSNPPMNRAATPEPGTIVMMAAGLLLVALGKFRKR